MDPLEKLQVMLRSFAAERGWDQFHSPKWRLMGQVLHCNTIVFCQMLMCDWVRLNCGKSVGGALVQRLGGNHEIDT